MNMNIDVKKLIALVKSHEELYNFNHFEYHNIQRRDIIWESIGKILNHPDKVCKDRWVKVRDNYRKALNLRKIKTDQGLSNIKPAKFYKELLFLVPYLYHEDPEKEQAKIDPLMTVAPPEMVFPKEEEHSADESTCDRQVREGYKSPIQCTMSSTASSFSSPSPKRRRMSEEQKTVASVLQEYLAQRDAFEAQQSSQSTFSHEQDPLINFFVMLGHTVKTFPVIDQINVKARVFELVNNVEMRIASGNLGPSPIVRNSMNLDLLNHTSNTESTNPSYENKS